MFYLLGLPNLFVRVKIRLIINHILSTKDKELLQHSATIDLNSQKFFST